MAENGTPSASDFADKILGRARACLLSSNHGHAFANFLMLLKVSPELRNDVKDEFAVSLNEWVHELSQQGQTKDAFWCFEQAMDLWPDNEMTLSSMAAFLFKLGYPDEAASYLCKALHINPDLQSARESLQSIASSVVERWHFRMLNDVTRNAGYLGAVQDAIISGHNTVLDIGSGTGLLSMFAVQSGAKSIYACEMSKTMYEMSHDVLAANQMQDQVRLLHKKSTELTLPDDLPRRVSLVVTETMDAGLLGEHILDTLHHAWQHLLQPPPQGKVIPSGATVYGQFIECEGLRKRHRLVSNKVGNLVFENINIVSKSVQLGQMEVGDESGCEPYTSEKLSRIPGGYTTLTPVFKVMDFDFQNFKFLDDLQRNPHQSEIQTTVHSKGQIDAIVTWFQLALDDQHSLSTAPGCESCWEQAIYPVHPLQLHDTTFRHGNLNVDKGHQITIAVACAKDHISLICQEISHNASNVEVKNHDSVSDEEIKNKIKDTLESQHTSIADLSLKNKTILTLEDYNLGVLNDDKIQTVFLSVIQNCLQSFKTSLPDSSISANFESDANNKLQCQNLNVKSASNSTNISGEDEKCMNRTMDTNPVASNSAGTNDICEFQNRTEKVIVSILDLSEILSLTGLYAAKLYHNVSVCMTQTHQEIQHALQCIGKLNGLDMETNVTFRCKSDVLHPKSNALWDIVIVDPVEPTGVLRQQVLEDITVARSCCMGPSGVIIPGTMTVFGICVESDSLLTDSKMLGDDRTMGLKISKYINVFKTSTQQDLNLSTMDYKQLSLPFLMFNFDFNQPCGTGDDIPSYLNQTKTMTIEITQDGHFVGIPYWFDLGMDKDHHVNTMDRSTYWRQAAFLLEEPMEVKTGQKVVIIATVKDSSIWFDVRR